MKRIVSISLGSSSRNAEAMFEAMGEQIVLSRIGTDGDLAKMTELLRSLDGNVDAIGLGGINLHLYAGNRRYKVREAHRAVSVLHRTPYVDGSGVKEAIERRLPALLQQSLGRSLAGRSVLLVSAVDRPFLYDAMREQGCEVVLGDLAFGLGLPVGLKSMRTLSLFAQLTLPVLRHLPISWLYPTGKKQTETVKGYPTRLMEQAGIIVGDFHLIRRYMPDSLRDKVIITNTVTREDRVLLSQRGPVQLITTSPNFEGRSFATNVIEALIIAIAGKPASQMSRQDYENYAATLGLSPACEVLG